MPFGTERLQTCSGMDASDKTSIAFAALAGSLVQKKVAPPSVGTFPVSGGTFLILLLGTVLLIGALNFLPALTLGPIVEHFLMQGGKLF